MTYRLVVVTVEDETLRALPATLGDTVSVQIFESANDALWELRMNPPEAVIAELDLPGMSGMELAEIIPNFEIPTNVLLYSPSPNDGARKQAEELGVYQFLHGPGAASELPVAIQAALHAARQAAAVAAAAAEEEEPEPEPEPEPEARPRRVAMRQVAPPPPAAQVSSVDDEPKTARRDFTPARVVLPSVREREQAAAAQPSAPRGGLASRTKAVADRKPEPKPEPRPEPKPEPAAEMPGRRGSGTLVVTAENINPIRKIMSGLAQELGAQSVMLTDRAGMVLVDVGTTDSMLMMTVLPLLSMSFSTAGEVARQLQEDEALTVYIHEGLNYDLYSFDVVQRFLLVLVFNKKVFSQKIGTVWINAKRTIRELRDSLANA